MIAVNRMSLSRAAQKMCEQARLNMLDRDRICYTEDEILYGVPGSTRDVGRGLHLISMDEDGNTTFTPYDSFIAEENSVPNV